MEPYILRPGEGQPEYGAAVKVSMLSTGGRLTLIESHSKGGAPWHVHSREDEYLYVVSGEIVVKVGDDEQTLGSGSFAFLPRDIPHAWDVVGNELATVLIMTVPAMLEEFLKEFHSAEGREAKDIVAQKYGIQFLWDKR